MGSLPAPHHHDPNEMMPNFAFWVMVAAPSCRFSRYRGQFTARSSSSRSHRALEATPQPSCPFLFVILLRLATPALRHGVLADSWQRSESYLFLCRYGRRSGQPSSSSLARRACVHYSGWLSISCTTPLVFVPFKFVYRDTLKIASAPGPFGGRGNGGRFVRSPCFPSWRGLRPSYVTPEAFPFWSLYSNGPLSSRPQPLGSVGDDTPCEDTREDFGLSV